MTKPKRRVSFQRLFPVPWQCKRLSDSELMLRGIEFLGTDPDRFTKSIVVNITSRHRWNADALRTLIRRESPSGETDWNVPAKGHVGLMWEGGQSRAEPPAGIMVFQFEVNAWTPSGRVSKLTLHNRLAWVRPHLRGRGLGLHLATHLCLYLQGCRVRYPYTVRGGCDVAYVGDYYSDRGERLSRIVEGEIDYLSDLGRETQKRREQLGWSVREFENEADGYDRLLLGCGDQSVGRALVAGY